jgi:23S rRNA (uracil1939-C5)-methyltransferase
MEKKMRTIRKNDELTLFIEDITAEGEGVGRADGMAFFVKDAITGDRVRAKVMKVKKSYGYARLLKLLEPSPARTEPLCPVARQCGGCQLQHMKYEEQLRYKENKIKECLKRIGGIDPSGVKFEPIIGMEKPFYYRNKAQFPVGKNRAGELVTGFFAGRTHTIIDTSHCYIQAEINEKLLSVVRDFLIKEGIEPYDEETHSGLIRHILTRVGFATKEIMVCLIINGDTLPKADRLVEELKKIDGMTSICININREKTNVILGKECKVLWGQGYITDRIGDVKYQISPLSFYQVNPRQTKRLYDTALEYANLTGEEIVWDLYCGIGTISLFLAQHAKQVYGVEIVEQAVLDARENKKINGIQNAEFFTGAAEEVMPQKYKESNGSMKAQVIVVDPPRKGCDERLLETIAAMTPERIVYVSCDPATLARDVKYLGEKGYRLERVRGCDMFGQSVHVETVVLLTKVYK